MIKLIDTKNLGNLTFTDSSAKIIFSDKDYHTQSYINFQNIGKTYAMDFCLDKYSSSDNSNSNLAKISITDHMDTNSHNIVMSGLGSNTTQNVTINIDGDRCNLSVPQINCSDPTENNDIIPKTYFDSQFCQHPLQSGNNQIPAGDGSDIFDYSNGILTILG